MVFDLNRSAGLEGDNNGKSDERSHSVKVASSSEGGENSVNTSEESGQSDESGEAARLALEIERMLEFGSVVESIDQVYMLYCEYARYSGFSVRKGCQKYFENSLEVRMKVFNCSCEGMHDNKRSAGRIPVYRKQVMRSNCKARLRVWRDRGGPWIVSVFEKRHNHELVNPEEGYLLRSARQLSHAKQSILESLASVGIPISSVFKFMAKESGRRQNVGFLRKDAYAHMNRTKQETKLANGDANALYKFFNDKANKEPFFFWKVHTDDDGRLMHFFFRDARCAIDYESFGDVLSVDTTYKTNKYNLVCAPFVGINHHLQNVMFGLGFLSDETTRSFEWLFGAFLESMNGKEPEVIFSDQCQALMNGVDLTFESAAHRLCQWHINQNAPSHFGKLNGNCEFKSMWHRCMNGCETDEAFEELWQQMVVTYDLRGIKWFRDMYNLRRRWSSVFTNDRFTAGLHATSRSEVTNKVLKDLGRRSNSVYEFVMNYLEVQADWRAWESAEDALCCGKPEQFVPGNQLLSHAAEILTRNVFKLFEFEATQSMNINVIQPAADYLANELIFYVASPSVSAPSRNRRVYFNRITEKTTCTCRMWETKGVLCRHIFKVYYILNVASVPEQYLQKRWRRDAKQRCGDAVSGRACGNVNVPDHVFVNQVMRITYDVAHKNTGSAESRAVIQDHILKMQSELEKLNGRSTAKGGHDFGTGGQETISNLLNPKVVRTRGIGGEPKRRKWNNTNRRKRIEERDSEGQTTEEAEMKRIKEERTLRSENRSGSGCGASVGIAGQSGSAGTVPAQASSMVDLIRSLKTAGHITVKEAVLLFDKVDEWLKVDHAGWVTLLLDPAITDLEKLKYLKEALKGSTSTSHG